MATDIGADAAKLAGLQIDTLSKFRAGQITFGQWERFNNLSLDDREARFGDIKKPKPTPSATPTDLPAPCLRMQEAGKFGLLVDLGIITVPDGYVHGTRLATFATQNHKKFYSYDNGITDANFPNPTRILKPGDKLRVRAFKQMVPGMTTSEERMAFLVTEKGVHTGAQGASVVWDQKRGQLPKGYWYVSFDEKERLWEDAPGHHRVPGVNAHTSGIFNFLLATFEANWNDRNVLLCFCDL